MKNLALDTVAYLIAGTMVLGIILVVTVYCLYRIYRFPGNVLRLRHG